MSAKYTCFVISPIGEPKSAIREQADEVFEYIIKPSLDKFDFAVERADHIRGIEDTITKEMVERIQRSDLCVVDLTGLNPNVMYECGRRHETGKPCILISRDAALPFDVATHPVIRYSLEGDAKEVLKTIRVIQQNVQHFVESGFERSGGKTIGDVFREVSALSQKVDVLVKKATAQGHMVTHGGAPTGGGTNAAELIKQLGGVVPAMNYAFANQDADLVDQLLPKVPNKETENFVLGGLVQGAHLGSRVAFEMLEDVILTQLPKYSSHTKARIVGGYAAGARLCREEERALPIVSRIIEEFESTPDASEIIEAPTLAMALNALQRLYHGMRRFEDALKVGDRILELDPAKESFIFNQSLNCMGAGQADRALDLVDRYVGLMRARSFKECDDDHLDHAIRCYAEHDRLADARELYLVMQEQYPLRAQIIRASAELSKIFN